MKNKLDVFYCKETDTLDIGSGHPAGYGADISENLIVNSNAEGEVVGFTLEHAAEMLLPYLKQYESQAKLNQ